MHHATSAHIIDGISLGVVEICKEVFVPIDGLDELGREQQPRHRVLREEPLLERLHAMIAGSIQRDRVDVIDLL